MPFVDWLFEIFVAPFWDGVYTQSDDAPKQKVGVKEWRLDKFDGDPPQPGEHKEPVEYLTGGDGLPTRRFVRTVKEGSVYWVNSPLEV